MIYLLLLFCFIALYGIVTVILNVSNIPKPSSHLIEEDEEPLVSILIPARNEAQNIEQCVRSVFNQGYKNKEVLVLDDKSTDETLSILKRLQAEFKELIILNGLERPDGWTGKNWACHNLSLKAKGEYFIFIDADTILQKDCVASAVSEMVHKNLGFCSFMPKQITPTLIEKISVPVLLFYVILSYYPLHLYFSTSHVGSLVAWGFMMGFSRSLYEEIGGHVSIKGNIMDDSAIARIISEHKGRVGLYNGSDLFSCRMYTNIDEVFVGLLRGSVPYIAFYPLLSLSAIAFGSIMHTWVPIWVMYSWLTGAPLTNELALGTLVTIVPIMMAVFLSIKFKVSTLSALFLFVGTGFLAYILSYGLIMIVTKKGVSWKGRYYNV